LTESKGVLSRYILSISLDPEIERRLSGLAKRSGKTEADYAQKLVEQDIEDLEDLVST
jgi:predicted DNA-binding protein